MSGSDLFQRQVFHLNFSIQYFEAIGRPEMAKVMRGFLQQLFDNNKELDGAWF